MDRGEAIKRLKQIEGEDLVPIAEANYVTILKEGKLNKG